MLSTMQDVPLLISRILRHGATIYGSSQVITWTGEAEPHRRSFAEVGERTAQLAHALRDELGVQDDDRVATLMWNNAEHVEAYFAVPSMGAVLHTLNLRLPRNSSSGSRTTPPTASSSSTVRCSPCSYRCCRI